MKRTSLTLSILLLFATNAWSEYIGLKCELGKSIFLGELEEESNISKDIIENTS